MVATYNLESLVLSRTKPLKLTLSDNTLIYLRSFLQLDIDPQE